MKKLLIATSVALLFGAAAANAQQVNIQPGVGNASNSQATSGSAALLGNYINMVNEAAPIPTDTTLRNTPGVVVSGPASGPCNGLSAGIGLGLPGFGGGVNFSSVDEGCEERETARILGLMGEKDAGIALIKSGAVWQRHLKRLQEMKKAEAIPSPLAAAPAPKVVAAADPSCTTDEFIARRMGKEVCPK